MLIHFKGDVLKAHRNLIADRAKVLSHPIQHMGGGNVANHRALPAFKLMEVVVQKDKNVIGMNIVAL